MRTFKLPMTMVVSTFLLTASPAFAESVRDVQALPSLAPLVDSVKAAVVNVEVVSRGGGVEEESQEQQGTQDFFGFIHPFQRKNQLRQGMGSGFVIDPRGYVLTNNHVVQGATSIRVKFDDGRVFVGETMGRDPDTDVALVKLKGKVGNLPYVKLGDSDAVRVGDWVVAIGNPFGLTSSVSAGILSARARNIGAGVYDDFLQTDAAINPGNSGGPLFNLRGEVVGINTAIVGGASSIGFAVPSNLAKALVPQLEKNGTVTRGYIGVGTQKVTPEIAHALGVPVNNGALVFSVEKDTPGQRAGLKTDDVITAVDGAKIDSDAALRRVVALKSPGSTVNLTVYRSGKPEQLKVTLATRPAEFARGAAPKNGGHSGFDLDEEERPSPRAAGVGLKLFTRQMAEERGVNKAGAVIAEVMPGSAADSAELAPGMVVVEANHQRVHGPEELYKLIKSAKPGSEILLRVEFPNAAGAQVRVLQKPI